MSDTNCESAQRTYSQTSGDAESNCGGENFVKKTENASVEDVYNWARIIGDQFNQLICEFGRCELIDTMTQSVIQLLENFEAQLQLQPDTLPDLFAACNPFCPRCQEQQVAHKEEEGAQPREEGGADTMTKLLANQVDASVRAELTRLKHDNQKLRVELVQYRRGGGAADAEIARLESLRCRSQEELELMRRVGEAVQNGAEQRSKLTREIREKDEEVQTLHSQLEQSLRMNEELQTRIQTVRRLVDSLSKEKKRLTDLLEQQQQQNSAQLSVSPPPPLASCFSPLSLNLSATALSSPSSSQSPPSSAHHQEPHSLQLNGCEDEDDVSTASKRFVLVDQQDPDRPRYTKTEMEDVLREKTKLKMEMLSMQELLDVLWPPVASEEAERRHSQREEAGGEPVQSEASWRQLCQSWASGVSGNNAKCDEVFQLMLAANHGTTRTRANTGKSANKKKTSASSKTPNEKIKKFFKSGKE